MNAKHESNRRLRIGWLTTANGPGSRGMFKAVLDAIESGKINVEFAFVFVNRERGQTRPTDSFLDLVDGHGIPLVTHSSARIRRERGGVPWSDVREEFDAEVWSKLSDYKQDFSVMAGYMLFAPLLCRNMLMLNQHPALPGGTIGRWQDAVWDSIETDASVAGSMIHIATPDLDRGPAIATCSFSLRDEEFAELWSEVAASDVRVLRDRGDESQPLFQAIRAEGVRRERHFAVETLKAISDGELVVEDFLREPDRPPMDLSERVALALTDHQH